MTCGYKEVFASLQRDGLTEVGTCSAEGPLGPVTKTALGLEVLCQDFRGTALHQYSSWCLYSRLPISGWEGLPDSWLSNLLIRVPQQGPWELQDPLHLTRQLQRLRSPRFISNPWLNHILPPWASGSIYCYSHRMAAIQATAEEVRHSLPPTLSLLVLTWQKQPKAHIPFLYPRDIFFFLGCICICLL